MSGNKTIFSSELIRMWRGGRVSVVIGEKSVTILINFASAEHSQRVKMQKFFTGLLSNV